MSNYKAKDQKEGSMDSEMEGLVFLRDYIAAADAACAGGTTDHEALRSNVFREILLRLKLMHEDGGKINLHGCRLEILVDVKSNSPPEEIEVKLIRRPSGHHQGTTLVSSCWNEPSFWKGLANIIATATGADYIREEYEQFFFNRTTKDLVAVGLALLEVAYGWLIPCRDSEELLQLIRFIVLSSASDSDDDDHHDDGGRRRLPSRKQFLQHQDDLSSSSTNEISFSVHFFEFLKSCFGCSNNDDAGTSTSADDLLAHPFIQVPRESVAVEGIDQSRAASTIATMKPNCVGYAIDQTGRLINFEFDRRPVGPRDVCFTVWYCGVCPADTKWIEVSNSQFPLVPGHEVVGIVKDVGSRVKDFKVGHRIGVATYINSCRDQCKCCEENLHVYCSKVAIDAVDNQKEMFRGGYSKFMVVDERFCFIIPFSIPFQNVPPLLCAGISVYIPIIRYKAKAKCIGIIGNNLRAQLAFKFAKAVGIKKVVLLGASSTDLQEDDTFVLVPNETQMDTLKGSLDFILNTKPKRTSLDKYIPLLKTGGVIVLAAGFPGEGEVRLDTLNPIAGRRSVTRATFGGIKDVKEMLRLCASKGIYPNVKLLLKRKEIQKALKEKDPQQGATVIDIINIF